MARLIDQVGILRRLLLDRTTLFSSSSVPSLSQPYNRSPYVSIPNHTLFLTSPSFSTSTSTLNFHKLSRREINRSIVKSPGIILTTPPSRLESSSTSLLTFGKGKALQDNPVKIKKATTMKKLHKLNKEMFGELLETQKEKNSRVKRELKGVKKLEKEKANKDNPKVKKSSMKTKLLEGNEEKASNEGKEKSNTKAEAKSSGKVSSSLKTPDKLPAFESRVIQPEISLSSEETDAIMETVLEDSNPDSKRISYSKGAERDWMLKTSKRKTTQVIGGAVTVQTDVDPEKDKELFPEWRQPPKGDDRFTQRSESFKGHLKDEGEPSSGGSTGDETFSPSAEQFLSSFYDDRSTTLNNELKLKPRSQVGSSRVDQVSKLSANSSSSARTKPAAVASTVVASIKARTKSLTLKTYSPELVKQLDAVLHEERDDTDKADSVIGGSTSTAREIEWNRVVPLMKKNTANKNWQSSTSQNPNAVFNLNLDPPPVILGAEVEVGVAAQLSDHQDLTTNIRDQSPSWLISVPYFNTERVDPQYQSSHEEDHNPIVNHDDEGLGTPPSKNKIISIPFPYSFTHAKISSSGKSTSSNNNSSSSSKTGNQQQNLIEEDALKILGRDFTPSSDTSNNSSGIIINVEDGNQMQLEDQVQMAKKVRPFLPSVSKVLNVTMPKEQAEALMRWQENMIIKMGVEGFRVYKENMLNNGKTLHSSIETFLRGERPLEEISVGEGIKGHWGSLKDVLTGMNLDEVKVIESHVSHPKLGYCGIVDCVAKFRNKLVLIDWKTSQKLKSHISRTYDNPLQIAAYIGAINYDPNYTFKIDEGLIVIAYEDGRPSQLFSLSPVEVGKYWRKWLERLELYYEMNPQFKKPNP